MSTTYDCKGGTAKMSTETQPLQRYSLSGATMGTRFSALFYAAGEIDQAAIQADLQRVVAI